eukprot:XP_008758098.1 PREDICTED: protein yippee-like 3 isoform X2 [Rattus norvegicus]
MHPTFALSLVQIGSQGPVGFLSPPHQAPSKLENWHPIHSEAPSSRFRCQLSRGEARSRWVTHLELLLASVYPLMQPEASSALGSLCSPWAAPRVGPLPLAPAMVRISKPKTFQAYLDDCHRRYSCAHCRAHLANHDDLISKGECGLWASRRAGAADRSSCCR